MVLPRPRGLTPPEPSARGVRRPTAFTLVELLVVLGIIAVLVALLFPALRRARKQAMVLATPIVYVGKDQKLHMADASGQMTVPLMSRSGNACPVCHVPPVWSPSGDAILFRMTEGGTNYTGLLNPMSERPTKRRATGDLVGWIDSTRYVEGDATTLYVSNIATNRTEQTVTPANRVHFLAPAPPHSPAPFIGVITQGASDVVCFIKKDFNPGKPVYITPARGGGRGGRTGLQTPKVDPMGEYVAWTELNGGAMTAFKHVREPAARAPSYLTGFARTYFCDWSEQGEMLCNTTRDNVNYELALFGRDGRLVRMIPTETPPNSGVVASWRKYGHQ